MRNFLPKRKAKDLPLPDSKNTRKALVSRRDAVDSVRQYLLDTVQAIDDDLHITTRQKAKHDELLTCKLANALMEQLRHKDRKENSDAIKLIERTYHETNGTKKPNGHYPRIDIFSIDDPFRLRPGSRGRQPGPDSYELEDFTPPES